MKTAVKQEKQIEDRLKKRYLERLALKVKKMRRDLLGRNWENLRIECQHIRESGTGFGFESLVAKALVAEELIPAGEIPRARILPGARQAVEALTTTIDDLLTAHSVLRR